MLKYAIKPKNLIFRYCHNIGIDFSKFSKEVICSDENIEKCMKSMQSAPPLRYTQKEYDTDSAVLIPLCLHNNEISLLYTLRSAKLRRHVRQVSFPGGLREAHETWEQCALRETEEEIGFPTNKIQIWGNGCIIRPPRMAPIMPIVGFLNEFDLRSLKVNEDEVDKCFVVSLKDLSSSVNVRHTQFRAGYSTPSFIGGELRIWGITGLITNLFLRALLPRDIYLHRIKSISKYESK